MTALACLAVRTLRDKCSSVPCKRVFQLVAAVSVVRPPLAWGYTLSGLDRSRVIDNEWRPEYSDLNGSSCKPGFFL